MSEARGTRRGRRGRGRGRGRSDTFPAPRGYPPGPESYRGPPRDYPPPRPYDRGDRGDQPQSRDSYLREKEYSDHAWDEYTRKMVDWKRRQDAAPGRSGYGAGQSRRSASPPRRPRSPPRRPRSPRPRSPRGPRLSAPCSSSRGQSRSRSHSRSSRTRTPPRDAARTLPRPRSMSSQSRSSTSSRSRSAPRSPVVRHKLPTRAPTRALTPEIVVGRISRFGPKGALGNRDKKKFIVAEDEVKMLVDAPADAPLVIKARELREAKEREEREHEAVLAKAREVLEAKAREAKLAREVPDFTPPPSPKVEEEEPRYAPVSPVEEEMDMFAIEVKVEPLKEEDIEMNDPRQFPSPSMASPYTPSHTPIPPSASSPPRGPRSTTTPSLYGGPAARGTPSAVSLGLMNPPRGPRHTQRLAHKPSQTRLVSTSNSSPPTPHAGFAPSPSMDTASWNAVPTPSASGSNTPARNAEIKAEPESVVKMQVDAEVKDEAAGIRAPSPPPFKSEHNVPLPLIPKWQPRSSSTTNEPDADLIRLQNTRAHLQAEHINISRAAHRALHELDMANMDLKAAEGRRRIYAQMA